jgi:hypothetical protein
MMIDDAVKTLNIISHQYADLTGKHFNDADRKAAEELIQKLGPIDEVTVRGGIALGLARTKHPKINSFRYFFGSISEFVDMPAQSREGYCQHVLRKLGRK